MRFKATDVYDYYRPSKCELRVALRYRGEPEDETETPFDLLLQKLGLRHEKSHLATLSGVVDLSGLEDQSERERRTLDAIRAGAAALYQPRFRTEVVLDGENCELVGEPDFLIRDVDGGGYFIRDSKLARNVFSDRHLAIPLQLQIYGLLYERATGRPPIGLQVHAGTGEVVPVPYDGDAAALDALRAHRRLRLGPLDAYEPVGWTKCGDCGFYDRCWGQAVAANDVSLLTTVRQDYARKLRSRGITAIRDIPKAIENPAFQDLFYEGKRNPCLRDFVPGLRRSAEAYESNKVISVAPPDLPNSRNFAMFDLEGMPPYLDEIDKIYLWGVKVFGERPSNHLYSEARFGPDGDREGWLEFLRLASRLLDEYPDLRFVHWGTYEKSKLGMYVERYGDPDGVAARVESRLLNLHDLVTDSVALPIPSYGLKVVEKYIGFVRKLPEARGDWAMARYIEATETSDPAARDQIMGQIFAYNEEDLDATWAVLEWLRSRSAGAAFTLPS